jgi:hypothetical protein
VLEELLELDELLLELEELPGPLQPVSAVVNKAVNATA